MMFSSVDLPEPDGPTIASSSPSSIASDTSSSAVTPPGIALAHPAQTCQHRRHDVVTTVRPSVMPAPLTSTMALANMPVLTAISLPSGSCTA